MRAIFSCFFFTAPFVIVSTGIFCRFSKTTYLLHSSLVLSFILTYEPTGKKVLKCESSRRSDNAVVPCRDGRKEKTNEALGRVTFWSVVKNKEGGGGLAGMTRCRVAPIDIEECQYLRLWRMIPRPSPPWVAELNSSSQRNIFHNTHRVDWLLLAGYRRLHFDRVICISHIFFQRNAIRFLFHPFSAFCWILSNALD